MYVTMLAHIFLLASWGLQRKTSARQTIVLLARASKRLLISITVPCIIFPFTMLLENGINCNLLSMFSIERASVLFFLLFQCAAMLYSVTVRLLFDTTVKQSDNVKRMFSVRRNRSTSAYIHQKHLPTKTIPLPKKSSHFGPDIAETMEENKFQCPACLP